MAEPPRSRILAPRSVVGEAGALLSASLSLSLSLRRGWRRRLPCCPARATAGEGARRGGAAMVVSAREHGELRRGGGVRTRSGRKLGEFVPTRHFTSYESVRKDTKSRR
ncbi:hypothetical protein DAI22_07g262666 [Oryza sativa Japonica Group]|nr:hypothetical protein DAI22_07g262666 [Oryza sativa Japonica Group]